MFAGRRDEFAFAHPKLPEEVSARCNALAVSSYPPITLGGEFVAAGQSCNDTGRLHSR